MGEIAPITEEQLFAAITRSVTGHAVIVRPLIAVGSEDARQLTVPRMVAETAEEAEEYVRELLADCWTVHCVIPLVAS